MTQRNRFLLNFNEQTRVSVDQAFIDRVQLTIGDWGLYGTEDNVCETLTNLRHQEVETAEGEIIPLFKGDPIYSFRQKLNIAFAAPKDDAKNKGIAPLLVGEIWYADRYRRPMSLNDAASRVHFKTTLNLTRFVQAQKFKLRTRVDRKPRLLTGLVLAVDPDESWFADEWPLVPATNIIIGPWMKFAYAKSKSLHEHFVRYLSLVDGLLDRSLKQATPEASPSLPKREKHYSLQEIEFYWEYDCDNPIEVVSSMLSKIKRLGSVAYEGSVDVEYPQRASSKVDFQSPSVKAKIAQGTWLKVYAKTSRRVRFEIELKSEIIGKQANGQTAKSRRALGRKITPLVQYATQQLNSVLPTLIAPPVPRSNVPALRLMSEINSVCEGPHVAEAIIGALVTFGRVSLYNNSPFKDPVHILRDKGVLTTVVPRSRNYVVTDEFATALEQLRSMTAAGHI